MIFRLALTWILFALITLCNANNAYQPTPSPSYNDESIVLNNLIPYEKFVEGDAYEPLLYGTYTVTENVSPYIPINAYTEGYMASLGSSYQTPANAYQAKPMPSNFNVYTAKNPTPVPVQYKPAQPQPYSPSAYQPAKSDVTYGLNYEHNQIPVFVPSSSYPSTVAYQSPPAHPVPSYSAAPVAYSPPASAASLPSYPSTVAYQSPPAHPAPAAPPAYPKPALSYPVTLPPYQPMIPPSVYPKPPLYTFPVKVSEKPMPAKNDTTDAKPATDKKEDTSADKPANSAPILNEIPAVKPPTDPKVPATNPPPSTDKPAVPPVPLPTPLPPSPPAAYDSKPVIPPVPTPLPQPPLKGKPTYPTRANYTQKFTGYRYIAKPYNRRSPTYETRSAYNQNHLRSYNPSYHTRSQAYPAPVAYSSPNPYPPSTLNYSNATKANDYYRRSAMPVERRAVYGNANQYKLPATSKHPTYARSALGYSTNYNANTPKNYYAAASPAYQTSIYNENNVAEAVLRGYSVNPDENNNKAIVRIFEEAYNAIYFDFRVCDLKKDHLYSIYIHDYGQLTAGCESAGGQYGAKDTYFNPILGLKTNPSGFLGSFKYNGENLNIQHFSKKLRLIDIIGRNIVIHEVSTNQKILPEALENNMLNSFSMLLNPLSSPLITSRRVACGVIGRANPYSFLRPPNQNCEIEVPVVEEKPEIPVRRGADENVKSEVKDTPKSG